MRPFESTDPLPKDNEKGADLKSASFSFGNVKLGDGVIKAEFRAGMMEDMGYADF